MRPFHLRFVLVFLSLYAPFQAFAVPKFTSEEYRKALWMSTRFFGGQRSGEGPNWLIMDHGSGKDYVLDADGDHSLAGGWNDCGDFLKFGETQYYAGYVLLKAYSLYPEGFDDDYDPAYKGYRESGDFSWEGRKGVPNGIPDLLDEAKYATDFYIKAARDDQTFYYEVGDFNYDHKHWVTSVAKAVLSDTDGGQPRKVLKNPEGSPMPSFCGAALALMSRVYRKFDPLYADTCLRHAKHAFAYAKAHPRSGTGSVGYTFPVAWQEPFADMAAELFWATGDSVYLREALSMAGALRNDDAPFSWGSTEELAAFNLVRLGADSMRVVVEHAVDGYRRDAGPGGIFKPSTEWMALSFTMGQAFASSLLAELDGSGELDPHILEAVDYALGANAEGQSFLVGFGPKSPRQPHHRNIYLSDAKPVRFNDMDSLTIPLRNRQAGILVGGTLRPETFRDVTSNYHHTEGCIHQNAVWVASLGHVLSRIAPVDTSRFDGHPMAIGSIRPTRPSGGGLRVRFDAAGMPYGIDVKGRRAYGPPVRKAR